MANLQKTSVIDYIILPKGTTTQRPSPQDGMIRYNTDLKIMEVYSNSNWIPFCF